MHVVYIGRRPTKLRSREGIKPLFQLWNKFISESHFRFRKSKYQSELISYNHTMSEYIKQGYSSFSVSAMVTTPWFSLNSQYAKETAKLLANRSESEYQAAHIREINPRVHIYINDDLVEYTPKFLAHLDSILDYVSTDPNETQEEIDLYKLQSLEDLESIYGSFYISEAVLGGVFGIHASYSKSENSEAEQLMDQTRFALTVAGGFGIKPEDEDDTQTISAGVGVQDQKMESSVEETVEREDNLNKTLYVLGGEPMLASMNSTNQWSASVGDHENWTLVEIVKTRPWYYLLDAKRRQEIRRLYKKIDVTPLSRIKGSGGSNGNSNGGGGSGIGSGNGSTSGSGTGGDNDGGSRIKRSNVTSNFTNTTQNANSKPVTTKKLFSMK